MFRLVLGLWLALVATVAQAGLLSSTFTSIDGGELALSDWDGRPVLVVNTASRCAFTDQYEELQAVYDTYRDAGLVVLAVPSNDFRQELGSAEEVQAFCELTYGIDMPMTDITPVTGAAAHPFYKAVRDATGFEPRWNFNKVLIGADGEVVGTWGSRVKPDGRAITQAIDDALSAR